MKVIVRLLLLAGAAAALSLVLRDAIARRVGASLARDVHQLAAGARTLIPPPRAIVPMLPSAPAPFVPMLPVESAPVVPLHAPKRTVAPPRASASPKSHVITRKELDDAIASRLAGARAVLARDAEGRPMGLRLSGVGALAPYGVHDGDLLVSANGMSLRTSDEALAALGALKDAKHVVVVLRRGDATYAVPLDLVD